MTNLPPTPKDWLDAALSFIFFLVVSLAAIGLCLCMLGLASKL